MDKQGWLTKSIQRVVIIRVAQDGDAGPGCGIRV